MPFFVRKLVEAALLPLGWCGMLVLWAVFTRRRWLAVAGVALLWAASTLFVSEALEDPLVQAFPERSIQKCPQADAVVVLGGNIVNSISPLGIQWGSQSARFFTGLDLKLAGKGKILVLTDSDPSMDPSQRHVEALRNLAIQRGIPAGEIVVIGPVGTTADEAQAVASLPGIRKVIVVSSGFHLPRANLLFTAYGLGVTPFPTDSRDLSKPPFSAVSLIPEAGGLYATHAALREYLGLATYRILYAVRPPKR
jgi:uncharacterized SAM-binding protein YcdF (DUF218 family)